MWLEKIKRLKNLIKRKHQPSEAEIAVGVLGYALKTTDAHLVALARLLFIKPSTLVREAHNIKANAEYLLEMLEEVRKIERPKEEKK